MADLEESLSLPELEAMLTALREKEHRENKFAAALKGIDLDESDTTAQDKFEEIERRVNAKLTGKNIEEIEIDELAFDFEVEMEEEFS